MYEKICVVSDDTAHAQRAQALGAAFGEAFGAELAETPTPASDNHSARKARLAGEQRPDARPWKQLIDDIRAAQYDLVVIGAVAADEADHAPLGPLCERFSRRSRTDTLVIKDPETDGIDGPGNIIVCIDGSPQAYAGLDTAMELGRKFNKTVEAVGVYDPYLHYTLFNGIVNVLTKEASSVFKFKDQEKLHEEIIDTGLAKIYQAHLEVARKLAKEKGVDLRITLLDGKAYERILKLARRTKPWLLVMGRIGVHSEDTMDIGATTENLLRKAPCNVLLTSRKMVPRVDIQAEESIQWTPEAAKKMDKVPSFVRGVATTSILRWALERGHSVITEKVINSAMGDLLPPSAAQAMGYVAEEIAIERDNLEHGNTYLCGHCGYAARDYRPVACPVCKSEGASFEEINREALQALGKLDPGALEVEETFDGKKLSWAQKAKDVLRGVPSGYQRRRTKARIEKNAKVRGLDIITGEFAVDMVQQELADTAYLTPRGEALKIVVKDEVKPDDEIARPRTESPLPWTDAAWKRMCRVPEGFMRDMTREKVEQFADKKAMTEVNLSLCEEGIAEGRRMMAISLGQYTGQSAKKKEEVREKLAPEWTPAADKKVDEAVERATAAGKFDAERAEKLTRGVAEERATTSKIDEIGQAFMAKLGKQLGYGHPLSERTTEYEFTWTPEAEARLETVPDFCREMARWRVEWTAVKKDLGRVITPEIMDIKFGAWGEISDDIMETGPQLEWAPETTARLEKIPAFVRGQVIQSVEGNAQLWGIERVDNDVLDRVIKKWIATGDFHEAKYGYKAE